MRIEAAIFDLDGVISKTAIKHAIAWKILFDRFLRQYCEDNSENYIEFDIRNDYLKYVDGKPRIEGIKSFLKSRNIEVEIGDNLSLEDMTTIWGLGKIKDKVFRDSIEADGVDLYESTIQLINTFIKLEIPIAVASSSKNCRRVLSAARIDHKFDQVFDGTDLDKEKLPGKPMPDLFLRAAQKLSIEPNVTVVFEDSVAGILSAKAGKFGYMVGIDRGGNYESLANAGSDVVVNDLDELDFDENARSLFLR